MSTIFSHAVNAIKTNTRSIPDLFQAPKKVISIHEPETVDPASVLNRIKPSKKHNKNTKSITIRKGVPDDSSDFDTSRIQKKTISKDLNKYLRRPSSKSESDDSYKRETDDNLATGIISRSSMHFVAFLKSLPRNADESMIRDIIGNNSTIIEIKMNNDKAEIEFYSKEAARHAVDLLNNRIIRGSKIKAEMITEFSLSSFNPMLNKSEHYDSQEVERPNYYSKEEIQEKNIVLEDDEENDDLEGEEEPEEKPSILSRIKKNR